MRNKAARTRLKTTLKKFDAALAGSDKETIGEVYLEAVKMIDQSAARASSIKIRLPAERAASRASSTR